MEKISWLSASHFVRHPRALTWRTSFRILFVIMAPHATNIRMRFSKLFAHGDVALLLQRCDELVEALSSNGAHRHDYSHSAVFLLPCCGDSNVRWFALVDIAAESFFVFPRCPHETLHQIILLCEVRTRFAFMRCNRYRWGASTHCILDISKCPLSWLNTRLLSLNLGLVTWSGGFCVA